MESLRELFWAGQEVYLTQVFLPIIVAVLILSPILIILFAFGFWRHHRLWRVGQNDNRSEKWLTRLMGTLAVAIANVRILRLNELYPGLMHSLIFGGTALLFLGKIIRLFSFSGLTVPPQSTFLYASLIAEIGAVLILIGGGMAIYRRYFRRPPRLDTQPDDTLIFVWAFLLILTGFMMKGYRIAISEVSPTDWAMWSPVGYLISHAFPTFMTKAENEILVWHRILIHTIPAFILLGYIWVIRSRLQHILLSPLNVFFRSLKPKGALAPIPLETAEIFGASKIEDFTWKQLLDLDACTGCGRCQDACPAHFSGKALNPKKVIQDLKTHLYEVYPIPLVRKPAESRPDMVTEVITEEVLWDCTTCRACQQVCPVYIEHIDKIIDMRRYLVDQGHLSSVTSKSLESTSLLGNPWQLPPSTRSDWAEDLPVKRVQEDGPADIVYWVGCTSAYTPEAQGISAAMVKILTEAGVDFAILGNEERCCGDFARRLGEEGLFQKLARENIESLQKYDVKRIVTHCPHCFNVIKNEYPQLGGAFEVIHHSALLLDLLKQGRIGFTTKLRQTITFHDPCYLGRYNDIYDAPRRIIQLVPGPELVEMRLNRTNSFCCGGSGQMWVDVSGGERINYLRLAHAEKIQAQMVITACPFCKVMLDEAASDRRPIYNIQVKDIAELVLEAI